MMYIFFQYTSVLCRTSALNVICLAMWSQKGVRAASTQGHCFISFKHDFRMASQIPNLTVLQISEHYVLVLLVRTCLVTTVALRFLGSSHFKICNKPICALYT